MIPYLPDAFTESDIEGATHISVKELTFIYPGLMAAPGCSNCPLMFVALTTCLHQNLIASFGPPDNAELFPPADFAWAALGKQSTGLEAFCSGFCADSELGTRNLRRFGHKKIRRPRAAFEPTMHIGMGPASRWVCSELGDVEDHPATTKAQAANATVGGGEGNGAVHDIDVLVLRGVVRNTQQRLQQQVDQMGVDDQHHGPLLTSQPLRQAPTPLPRLLVALPAAGVPGPSLRKRADVEAWETPRDLRGGEALAGPGAAPVVLRVDAPNLEDLWVHDRGTRQRLGQRHRRLQRAQERRHVDARMAELPQGAGELLRLLHASRREPGVSGPLSQPALLRRRAGCRAGRLVQNRGEDLAHQRVVGALTVAN